MAGTKGEHREAPNETDPHSMLRQIFGWPVVGFIVASVVGLGGVMLSVNPPEFLIARYSFVLAAVLLSFKVAHWSRTSKSGTGERMVITFLIFGTIGVLAVESWRWVDRRTALAPHPVKPPGVGTEMPQQVSKPELGTAHIEATVVPKESRVFPPHELKLIFKDSPLFTVSRRRRIADEMEKFYRYLVELGLEAPKEVPPIGTRKQGGFAMAYALPGPVYMDSIGLPSSELDNPMTPVRGYAMYCFPFMLHAHGRSGPGWDRRQRASWVFQGYFVSSFTNDPPQTGTSDIAKWIDGLWDVRQRYGQQFSDRLSSFALKSLNDFPENEKEIPNFNAYFYNAVMAGEFVLDNDLSRMGPIAAIFQARDLIPKANR
jgi:hypothetical protein